MKASLIYCIHCTLPTPYCVCQYAPNLAITTPCALLYHPLEYTKHSNTGRLLKIACDIESQSWHRLKNNELEEQFKDFALLYPTGDSEQSNGLPSTSTQTDQLKDHHHIKGYLILDATWQQSQKMMRQSPWLAALPRVSIDAPPSQYRLRRNQSEQGLSTLESAAYLLIEQNQRNCGLELLQFLECFQDAFLKARQAGLLK
ncbi:MAG: DTW domain-containing protein [Bermanella sp.]